MHQQLDGWNISPFQALQAPSQARMPAQQAAQIKADQICAVEMMTDVQMPDVLEGGVGAAGEETCRLPRPSIAARADEQILMCGFVEQIRRQHHRLGAQQHTDEIEHGM